MNQKKSESQHQLITRLASDPELGLNLSDRRERLAKHGPNRLETKNLKSPLNLFFSQFGDIMVLMLLGATLVSGLLGEIHDALTIMVIVFINALLGFIQEYKAERSLNALQDMISPKAQVLINGELITVDAESIVPGDVIQIQAGDKIPADLRLLQASSLEVEEAPLTGETVPVAKDPEAHGHGNSCFMGCLVTRGRGRGVVTNTGMKTRMGEIAGMIQHAEQPPTPLQNRLTNMGKILVFVCLAISAFVAVAGALRGEPIYKMFMAGVSLAVAAIPEGLPAVVTLCLAIGLQRMLRRNAIVRKLPAVETLGCATVICSDKTGTLTQNQMTVEKAWLDNQELSITGRGFSSKGEIFSPREKTTPLLEWFLNIGVMANGASLKVERGKTQAKGDPTDAALLVLGLKGGVHRRTIKHRFEVIDEYPFDSFRKMMSVVVRDVYSGRYYVYAKGAPEVILPLCNRIDRRNGPKPKGSAEQQETERTIATWTSQAYRVLALAWKEVRGPQASQLAAEQNLTFSGLVALNDPPRPQVAEAVLACIRAGIRPIMITGDHRETAVAIAKRVNLPVTQDGVLTGQEISTLSDQELMRRLDRVSVCARVYPEHKMRLVRLLKQKGHVVAMTGDGVNDAPAVKEANIGIAMGITGTEVTKEAAHLILADDNFATIVAAVEEGRTIYDNIRKFIKFLLSCNAGEVFTMFFAMLLGFPLPLRAIQILWVNLVTDGLPALALSMEPGCPGIMDRPPRPMSEGILARGLGLDIFMTGLTIGVLTLMVFAISLARGVTIDYARTMALSTLICIQLIYAFSCRNDDWGRSAPLRKNLWLVGALIVSLSLLVLILYNPVMQKVFSTVALTGQDWLLIIGASLVPAILRRIRRLLWNK
jgi:Ca2+-transporting ATPase